MDLAKRAYDHNYHFDPIVRSLLDTDFYKLIMNQFILSSPYKNAKVSFRMINRSQVKLPALFPIEEFREQLDWVKSLRFRENELVWLSGNRFYQEASIFSPKTIEFLRNFQLPDYSLYFINGEYVFETEAAWCVSSLWEIYVLAIAAELKTRAALKKLNKFELDILYSNAKVKLWNKLQRIKEHPGITFSDFGTRRRHSFLWQEWVVQACQEALGPRFLGTSNTYLAMKHSLEAMGTNAHEIPMVYAAIEADKVDGDLIGSQYKCLSLWQIIYGNKLRILLPDTYGTTQFIKNAPPDFARWSGVRIDSKDPETAANEFIRWWKQNGENPFEKKVIFSDGLDVDTIIDLHQEFSGVIKDGYGWGTMLTNDFVGCNPNGSHDFDPISLVCKVSKVNGMPAVKLSDNYLKATGEQKEVDYYRRVFGIEGMDNIPVKV